MPQESETFHVRVRGPFACFTRPEFKVERVVPQDPIAPRLVMGSQARFEGSRGR
jgi:hypothetical protein